MSLADETLTRLLQRGERATLRLSDRAIQESFRNTSSPYWRLPLDERDRCHERLRAAEKIGGIELKWARQGGDDRPLDLVRLRDVEKLAAFLNVETVAITVANAHARLESWLQRVPRVGELLQIWQEMKSIRGLTPASAGDFADALFVLDALASRPGEDQVVRSLSTGLFGNSKRIEQLERHLDILTADALSSPARHWNEVFGAIGLVKEPQPFLVAGTGSLHLTSGQNCPVVRPFVGVSNKTVTSYEGAPNWVLTIENLTTFNLAAQLLDGGAGLIVFTGGMPSPSWCATYKRLLASLPPDIAAYHWGDIDQGGFRIAVHIRDRCLDGRAFLPWLMDSSEVLAASRLDATEATRNAMAKYADKAGWEALARSMQAVCIEQEGITPVLPATV